MKKDLADLKYASGEIKKRSKRIYHQILAESENIDCGNFKAIGTDDLVSLFELYDLHFFNRFFHNNYRGKIFLRPSQRMTRAAGRIAYTKHDGTYTISLSTTLISQTFHDVRREVVVNGIVCRNRLEATMRVLEHEIIHLLEWVLFGGTSCSKPRFRSLSRNIFGHTDVTHQLVTQTERAHKRFNLQVGAEVVFEYDGKTYHGVISRITKRATVMVRDSDGHFQDSRGNLYSKYYIPIQYLRRSKGGYKSD